MNNHWIRQREIKKRNEVVVYLYVMENGNTCRVGDKHNVNPNKTTPSGSIIHWMIDEQCEADGYVVDCGVYGTIVVPFSQRIHLMPGDTIDLRL